MLTRKRAAKTSLFSIAFVACLSISLGGFQFASSACDISLTQQQNVEEHDECVDITNKLSWASWLAGKSASYQFHYLDLLELLHRNAK